MCVCVCVCVCVCEREREITNQYIFSQQCSIKVFKCNDYSTVHCSGVYMFSNSLNLVHVLDIFQATLGRVLSNNSDFIANCI